MLKMAANQATLAYATAKLHGLDELRDAAAEQLKRTARAAAANAAPEADDAMLDEMAEAALPDLPDADDDLLRPPVPVLRLLDDNWPLLTVSAGYFKGGGLDETSKFAAAAGAGDDADLDAAADAWGGAQLGDDELGDDDLGAGGVDDGDALAEGGWGIDAIDDGDALAGGAAAGAGGDSGWADDDLDGLEGLDDIELDSGAAPGKGAQSESYWVPPAAGPSCDQQWSRLSNLAAEHGAAGTWDSCASLLHAQVGAVSLEAMRASASRLWIAAHTTLPGMPSTPALVSPSLRTINDAATAKTRGRFGGPKLGIQLSAQINTLKEAYKATTQGQFGTALSLFQSILASVPLLVVNDHTELSEVRELLALAREYALGLQLELGMTISRRSHFVCLF